MSKAKASKHRRERFNIGQDNEFGLKGRIADSYVCVDCGMDTCPGHTTRAELEQACRDAKAAGKNWKDVPTHLSFTEESELYYVYPPVWEASGMGGFWNGCLCIGCLEKRIGRRLQPEDFIAEHDEGFNDPHLPGTQRRFERLTGYSKLDLILDSAFSGQARLPTETTTLLEANLGKR
jgi:hypothetical protein